MKLGLYGINVAACAEPEALCRVATAAEEAGFESLWTAEHVVLPDPQVPPSPVPPQTPLLDPAVALAFAAARTRSIRLATGIVILPQRNPVVLAKEFASVDRLSGGRLILGVAAGYLEAEFRALGAPFAERGARTDEAIEVIRTLWSEERPRFEGRFTRFEGIQQQPPPLQRPHPPIVLGGYAPPALRRAWRQGDGWYGFALDEEATAAMLERLRSARDDVEAPRDELEITVTPPGPLDADRVRRYRDLGVHRLVPLGVGLGADDVVRALEGAAEALEQSGVGRG